MSGPTLTRIKNNQITDSTIWANAKIVPGSIVGSLFNSNITVTSDFTITGNLTVQGASTYLTVASTNTYVNDPLIVLNNAFSGTNTYDLGFVFNRGSLQNTALIWNEFNKEFRLVGTTETGTTYGNINQSNFANLQVGNLTTQYTATIRGNLNQTLTGIYGATFAGNVGLNGPYITTSQSTLTMFSDATTVNFGATSGTLVVNNPTIVGSQSTQNVFNANATTVNAFQAASTLNVGANSGTLTIGNPTVVGTQSTQNLYNSTATTMNFAGAATTVSIGASTGTTTVNSKTFYAAQDLLVGGNLTVQGNITYVNSNTLDVDGAIIDINTMGNGAPLTANILTDSGIMSHYYNGGDTGLFFGRRNLTGYFTIYQGASFSNTSGNVSGTIGTVNANLIVSNGGVINLLSNAQILMGGDLNGNVVYTESVIGQLTASANITSRFSLQNKSTGSVARSEFTAMADTGSNISTFIGLGIVSSAFAQPNNILSPTDGYLRTQTSNLWISTNTVGKNIFIAAGGVGYTSNIIAIANGTSSNLTITSINNSTSSTTGALTVVGGVGIGGNLVIGGQGTQNFTIQAITNTAGVIYSPQYQSLIINGPSSGANVAWSPGVTFGVRSNDSMVIPVGTTAQRPSNTGNVDVRGMLRFNTSLSNLEWYDGSNWNTPGASTTIIQDQQINGDGATTTFTVNNATTTNATIVSVNGVLQLPTISYAMVGGNIVFTEAPATGDVIDVRSLTTTTTINQLSSSNGFMIFDVSSATNGYANIIAGVSSPTTRIQVAADGIVGFVNGAKLMVDQTAVNIAANATPYVIDSFAQGLYTSATYQIKAKRGTGAGANIEAYSATVITDGAGSAWINTYGVINNGYAMGTLSANVLAGNVQMYYTGTNAAAVVQANVKTYTTYIV